MASKNEDFFDNRYDVCNRWFLTIVGLWPYQGTTKRLCCACFMITLIVLAITLQTYILFTSTSDVKRIAVLMQTFLPTITFSFFYINGLIHISGVKQIFEHMKNDWNRLNNLEESMAMKRYTDTSRICCRLIACIFYIYIFLLLFPTISCFFLYIFGVIDDSQLILAVNNEAFMSNHLRYLVMAPLQIIGIFMLTTIGTAFCTTIILVAQHACLLFNVLTIRIQQRFKKASCKFSLESSNTTPGDEFQWIISIIKYHDEVINFSSFVQMLFGATYIMHLLIALMFIILDFFYVFQIIDMTITTGEAIKNSIFIIGNLLMIYASLYLGQRLIDHSIRVYTECCLIPFYELSVETNKLLLILTSRCMKPCYISVSGMLIASNQLFTKIMKTSLSFATVVYNARNASM